MPAILSCCNAQFLSKSRIKQISSGGQIGTAQSYRMTRWMGWENLLLHIPQLASYPTMNGRGHSDS